MKRSKTALSVCAALALILSGCAERSKEDGTGELTKTREVPPATTSVTDKPAETEEEPVRETGAEDFETVEENGGLTISRYTGEDTSVVIPAEINGKAVTAIGFEAFYETAVESVVIPDGVTAIGARAFYGCERLTDLTIPESVTEFGWGMGHLSDASDLQMEQPFRGTPWLEEKRAEDPLVIVNRVVIDGKTCVGSVTIPDGTVEILAGAFENCAALTSAELPKGLEKIGVAAFWGCSALTEIVLPDSVSAIGDYAFCMCDSLENVVFPDNTVEMGRSIFSGNVIDAMIPVPCPWLRSKRAEDPIVIVNGNLIDATEFDGDLVIPDSVRSIAPNALSGLGVNARLTSVRLPDGITRIPESCFHGCGNMTSVTIPDSVTEIGSGAFEYCYGLDRLTLPDGVVKIDGSLFSPLDHCTVVYRGESYPPERYDELYTILTPNV